jgi:hypothetical protein
MKFAQVLVDVETAEIQSITVFEAEDEETAIKQFENENQAAADFEVPYANMKATWILKACYEDDVSDMYLYPVTNSQNFHG